MRKDNGILNRLSEDLDLLGEPIPGQLLLELASDRRVLIENHMGITQYDRNKICVKVKFGHIAVCGCNLELNQMTRYQLVISGRIDTITIHRRNAG